MADKSQDEAEPPLSSWPVSANASRHASTGVTTGPATYSEQPQRPNSSQVEGEDFTKSVTRGTYEAVKGVQYGTVDFIHDVFGAPKQGTATKFTEPIEVKEMAVGPEKLEIPEPFQKDISYVAEVFKKLTYVDEGKIMDEVSKVEREGDEKVKALEEKVDKLEKQLSEMSDVSDYLNNHVISSQFTSTRGQPAGGVPDGAGGAAAGGRRVRQLLVSGAVSLRRRDVTASGTN
eukprot:1361962-Rhodomonas_salina.2